MFDLAVKKVKVNPKSLLENLGNTLVPAATYQISRPSVHQVWRKEDFKGFYHILVWLSCWSCHLGHLDKFLFPQPQEAQHEIGQWLLRCLKLSYYESWVKNQGMTLTSCTHISS